MIVFYCEEMVADIGDHLSPSSKKPRLMADALAHSKPKVELERPKPVTRDISKAIDKAAGAEWEVIA